MAPSFPVTRSCLFAATLVGLAAAIGTFFFPVDAPESDELPNTLSISFRAPNSGVIGLAYDYGASYDGSFCHYVSLPPSNHFTRVAFPLPSGTIVFLQLIFPNAGITISAKNACVLDAGGNVLRRLPDSDLQSSGKLVLRDKLNLPPPPPRRHLGTVVLRERTAAILLALAEVGLLFVIYYRSKSNPLPNWLVRTATGLSAGAILFSRRPSVIISPQFWAEDGTIYFLGRAGGWHSLWESQGNYLALVPRVTAALSNLAPVWYAPIIYEIVALGVCLWAVVKATSPRMGLPYPVFAGLAIVLVPNMDEITANVTNAQWFGAVILVLVCLSRSPTNFFETARDTVALILFGLTGPFIIFTIPLLLWRACRARSRVAWMLLLIGAGLCILQYRTYCSSQPTPFPASIPQIAPFLAALGYRTGGQLFGLASSASPTRPIACGFAGFVLIALLWLGLRLKGAVGELKPALMWVAVVIVVGGFLRYADHALLFFEPVFILRYFYIPFLFSVWLLLGGLEAQGLRRGFAFLALSAAIVCNIPYYRMAPYTDLHWSHSAWAIEHGEKIKVPINPPPWSFDSPQR